jgi:hypothetical protein
MTAYVIKSWSAVQDPRPGEPYINIEGRAAGLMSWLLNLLDISPTVRLVVLADKVNFEKGSLEGTEHRLTPSEHICSTFYAFRRPWKEAIILGIVLGVLTFFSFGLIGIALAILYYVLNKTLTLGFTDMSGHERAIPFKRSVIEGQVIDETQAARVCDLMQRVVDRQRERALVHAAASGM